ncbi:MAG: F0F1 ATP synthase subunit B [Acidiferrobacter sp.]
MDIDLTLLIQIIAFLGFLWFIRRKVWGPVSSLLEKRAQSIADGIAAGERGTKQLMLASRQAADILETAHTKAEELLSEAADRQRALIEQARQQAQEEAQKILVDAQLQIAQERVAVRESLRQEAVLMAMAIASRILQRKLDESGDAELIADLAKEI